MHSPVLLAKPVLIVEALLCPPANQRGEMSSRQWCVRPRSPPAPTRAPGGVLRVSPIKLARLARLVPLKLTQELARLVEASSRI